MTVKKTPTLVWMTMIALTCAGASLAQQLVFANTSNNEIWIANKDGSGAPSVLHSTATASSFGPVQLDAVPSTNKLYIGGGNNPGVWEANLDGTGTSTLLPNSTVGSEHFGVAADPAGGRYFFSTDNSTSGSIHVANLDGTGVATTLFSGLTGSVHGLEYDASSDRLYFAEIRDDRITRANADGTGTPTVLFDAADGVAGPRGISIDVANGWIYWAQQGGISVNRAAIDGSGTVMTLFTAQPGLLTHSVKIDPVSQLLYWTEFTQFDQPAAVMVGNADGSGTETVLFATNNGMLRGIDFTDPPVAVPGMTGTGITVLILLILGTMIVMYRKHRLPGMRWLIVVLFLAGLSMPAWAPPALADTVSPAPTRDATLYSEIPTNASGSGPTLIGGVNAVGAPTRTVLAFDVAGGVPAGATIDSVELRLNYMHSNNSGAEAPGGYALHPLLADWGEGPSNAGPFPGAGFGAAAIAPDTTWLHMFSPGSFWVTPGGDFAAASSAAISIPSDDCNSGIGLDCGIYTWTSPAMAADVQGWLDNPAGNFGWILKGADETLGGTTRGFDSREGAVPPELVVNFTPGAVPGVSGWGIAVFALAMMTALTLLMVRRARA
jgi:hypothetical protein